MTNISPEWGSRPYRDLQNMLEMLHSQIIIYEDDCIAVCVSSTVEEGMAMFGTCGMVGHRYMWVTNPANAAAIEEALTAKGIAWREYGR